MRRAERIVVVGGGIAGRAAIDAYRAAGGRGNVLLVARAADEAWLAARRVQPVSARALALDADDGSVAVEVSGERLVLHYDRCLLATGADAEGRPRSQLAAAAGLLVADDGAIAVDGAQRTTGDGVLAAGACCSSAGGRAGAAAQGSVAGRRLAGEPAVL